MYILFVTEMSGGALIKNGISKSGRERLDFFFFFCNDMDKRQIQGGGEKEVKMKFKFTRRSKSK
jgi:hypothetical protein